MWLFEVNFELLQRLLPRLEEAHCFDCPPPGGGAARLEVRVTERARYTTTLSLHHAFRSSGRLLADLTMRVRLYHDAGVAEVTGYQGCQRLPPPYEVTASGRFQRDEKRQANRLLHELLSHFAGCSSRIPSPARSGL